MRDIWGVGPGGDVEEEGGEEEQVLEVYLQFCYKWRCEEGRLSGGGDMSYGFARMWYVR